MNMTKFACTELVSEDMYHDESYIYPPIAVAPVTPSTIFPSLNTLNVGICITPNPSTIFPNSPMSYV